MEDRYISFKFYQTVEKAINLIKLNILWILFSIPIITIGAATCALHNTAAKIVKNEEGYIFRDFITVFKRKWKQALRLWISLFFIGFGLFIDLLFWRNIKGIFAEVMIGILLMLVIIWVFLMIYTFPLAVRMETRTRVTLRNALFLSVKYLPKSLYMLLWLWIFLMAAWLWFPVFLIEFFAGIAILTVIWERVLLKIFEEEQILEPIEFCKKSRL